MFCTNCGNKLEDNQRFCRMCGKPVPVSPETVTSKSVNVEESSLNETTVMDPVDAEDVDTKVDEVDFPESPSSSESGVSELEEPVEAKVSDSGEAPDTKALEPEGQSSDENPETAASGETDPEAEEGSGQFGASAEVATSVIDPIDDLASSSALPDSAFEPTIVPSPAFVHPAPQAYVAPQVPMGAMTPVVPSSTPASKRRSYKLAIGISSAAAVLAICAVGVFLALGRIPEPDIPINEEAFPNDVIRGAVLEQLDADGDGVLSDDEAKEVTALVYTPVGAKFVTGGEEVDVPKIRTDIARYANMRNSANIGNSDGSDSSSVPSGSAVSGNSGEGRSDNNGSNLPDTKSEPGGTKKTDSVTNQDKEKSSPKSTFSIDHEDGDTDETNDEAGTDHSAEASLDDEPADTDDSAGESLDDEISGSDEQSQTSDSSASDSSSTYELESISRFPNIKTLVASDAGLQRMDLGSAPQLEYVDLRDNPDLTMLDLSNNKNIKVLFCDEDTKLTGLQDAGLYYTDLVTSMQLSGSSKTTIEVEYDSHARPIKANGYTFTYDDKGRIVKEKQADAKVGNWYSEYSYGSNGLLATASTYNPLDVSQLTGVYAYGYDSEGRLAQFAYGSGKNKSGKSVSAKYKNAGEFSYQDGTLASFKSTDVVASFTMNSSDMIEQSVERKGPDQTETSCDYASSGAMTSYETDEASVSGYTSGIKYATEYSESGAPVKTICESGSKVSYKCNPDGYITEIEWGDGEFYMAGSKGRIGYVKRVGALADRASERFVPVIRPIVSSFSQLDAFSTFETENWFSTTADYSPVTVAVLGPRTVTGQQMGVFPNMLSNENELSLAVYDREHWDEGLDLSDEQPIAADGVNKLLGEASKASLPVSAETLLSDKVYGPVLEQYISLWKEASSTFFKNNNNKPNKYNLIPDGTYAYVIDMFESSEPDPDVVDVTLVDLNSDGIDEMVVAYPGEYLYGPDSDDGRNAYVDAVYSQEGGKAIVVASEDHVTKGHGTQCQITEDGDILLSSGAKMYGSYVLEKWNGSETQEVGGIEYGAEYDAGNTKWVMTVTESDGSKKTSTVSESVVNKAKEDFLASIKYAELEWIPVPVS